MIEELIVKNFALIKEANINFKKNLNVLSGETGSGKSILIGSIDLAMGKRANRDTMLSDSDNTEVCITFYEKNDDIIEKLKKLDVELVDDRVIIYRKVTKEKNISKINDMPCTLNKIKDVTELLVDIYGQHDSEDLRKNAKHIEFLDDFIGKECKTLKKDIEVAYDKLKDLEEYYKTFDMDEDRKKREIELLEYEIKEIDDAKIKEGEEENLSDSLKQLSNASKIIEGLNIAKEILEDSNIGKAVKELNAIEKYDDSLASISKSIIDVDSIVTDAIKDIDRKIDNLDIDDSELNKIESRLNLIRGILSKYKNNIDIMKKEYENKKERLNLLANYDVKKEKAESDIKKAKKELENICEELSKLRRQKSKDFIEKLKIELEDLGFLDIQFDVNIEKSENIKYDGYDDVSFMISLNKGEKLRNLSEVASGGELSRIMLSIKTIMSKEEGTDCLIFDEIDQGISGITASKVAKKLNKIAKTRQVLCITHLPQIASMADYHYLITKNVKDDKTKTNIQELDRDGMIKEIGRLIASDENLTDTVLANAKELKNNADIEKEKN